VSSERLKEWAAAQGLMENKHQVPASVFGGGEEMQRGFLQALFTADGQVSDGGEKGCSVRLSSSHLPLLKDVQRLLLNFGIACRIYEQRRAGGYRQMPDGHGGHKEYFHQPQHDLAISKTNLIQFANAIGFLTEAKQTKLANYLSRMTRGPYDEPFLATIDAVEPDGREQVYDLQQPDTSSFIANGLVVHNCGEQWLGPYENCCLGSINLAPHITPDNKMDWAKLRDAVELATHFLDNVVDANKYVPAVPELAEAAHRARRIGLGIMGLGDAMYRLGVRYGSRAGEEFAGQVMEFVRFHSMKTSIELAKTRGAFPAIKGSLYDPENLKWTPPKPIEPYTREWNRPRLDWGEIVAGIKKYGIRNAAQTTVAPTGTIATVAGVESYGCEPVFALAYTRHVDDNGKDLQLEYVSPAFERALSDAGLDEPTRQKIFARVRVTGTCQDVDLVPEKIRDPFVVASDIAPEQHVRMQAALQAFVDNSMSKTINFPATATPDDVERAYFLAWKLGCKGITVYVAGSRDKVILETRETVANKSAPSETPSAKKPRPRAVHGSTYEIATPLGKAYVTVNRNGSDQPFEVFCNVGKAGSDTAAVSEAIGRLISLALRLPSPLSPTDRLQEIVDQLGGIGGGRSMGFGARRVRSLPDGIAQALAEDLGQVRVEQNESKQMQLFQVGDLCPECGQASFVNEEGCRKCYACGYSEC
jgi:ribonucleoside-diphosphate reductase alpha chain